MTDEKKDAKVVHIHDGYYEEFENYSEYEFDESLDSSYSPWIIYAMLSIFCIMIIGVIWIFNNI